MRRSTVLRIATCVAVLPRAVRAADLLGLQVGAMPTDGSAEVLYAVEQGFFKPAGLEPKVTVMTNTASLAAAVTSGSLEIGYGSVIPLAEAKVRGIPFRVLAPATIYNGEPSPNLLLVAKGSAARTAADLNGKTIAVNGLRDLTQYEVQAFVDKNGGDVHSIKLTEIPFSEMGAALAAGRVDAAIVAEPFLSLAKTGARVLGNPAGAIAPRYAITCWFATEAWLARNPEQGKRFAAVVAQTARWANAHRRESAAILGRTAKISPDTLSAMTRSLYDEGPPEPALFQPPLDAATRYGTLPKVAAADLLWQPPA